MAGGGAGQFADIRTRLLSALALGAVALACVWLGGWASAVLGAAAGGLGVWELKRITTGAAGETEARLLGAAGAAAALLAHVWGLGAAAAALAALSVAAALADRSRGEAAFWSPVALLTAGLAGASFVAMRDLPAFGLLTVFWIGFVVVATDTGAYAVGRLVGGPKLWPRVSPNKTWAGAAGGALAAAAVGAIFSAMTTGTYIGQLALVSALAGLVSQAGDLAESALKRRFGVKDSSRLIPGHGGVMDRLDGFCAATLTAAAFTFLRGQPVFVW